MKTALVTGADGHLGKAIAQRLLAGCGHKLVLLVRADGDAEKARKFARLGNLASDARCRVVFADLGDSAPFDKINAAEISEIVHAAAATSFGVDRDTAAIVNVAGTQKLLEFAGRCLGLQRVVYLSSLYATGLNSGVVDESPLESEPAFANHYEWSKWTAERSVANRKDLPWQIHRVATLLAENTKGVVVQQNAIHNTLRLLYYGLLSVIPGRPDTRVYMTTTSYACESICRLLEVGESCRVFHVSDGGDAACTLGQLLDVVYDTFNDDPDFARLRILKPLFCDLASFNTLAEGAAQLGGAMAQSLNSVAPFAPQLFNDKNVLVEETTAELNSSRNPDMKSLLEDVCGYLATTRWGLRRVVMENQT
jgi:nucleoside-diphosphate-sugar epimerase